VTAVAEGFAARHIVGPVVAAGAVASAVAVQRLVAAAEAGEAAGTCIAEPVGFAALRTFVAPA
jgi:hypothetical protein